jgi:hypothetical protein
MSRTSQRRSTRVYGWVKRRWPRTTLSHHARSAHAHSAGRLGAAVRLRAHLLRSRTRTRRQHPHCRWMLRCAVEPKRWISVMAPPTAAGLPPSFCEYLSDGFVATRSGRRMSRRGSTAGARANSAATSSRPSHARVNLAGAELARLRHSPSAASCARQEDFLPLWGGSPSWAALEDAGTCAAARVKARYIFILPSRPEIAVVLDEQISRLRRSSTWPLLSHEETLRSPGLQPERSGVVSSVFGRDGAGYVFAIVCLRCRAGSTGNNRERRSVSGWPRTQGKRILRVKLAV